MNVAEDLERFLDHLRSGLQANKSSNVGWFEIYANEARFVLDAIKDDLAVVGRQHSILEVGGGAFFVSGFLARCGYDVTVLEPLGTGFDHLRPMQTLVLDNLESSHCKLVRLDIRVEELELEEKFDYVFSFNVFEHIDDIHRGITNSYDALKSGGLFRIYCPNSDFPYEPHFNIPTLFSKRLTEIVFRRRISNASEIPDPKPLWEGLNWINYRFVKRELHSLGAIVYPNRDALLMALERSMHDPAFNARRPTWLRKLISSLERIGVLRFSRFVPPTLSPIIDLRVEKPCQTRMVQGIPSDRL